MVAEGNKDEINKERNEEMNAKNSASDEKDNLEEEVAETLVSEGLNGSAEEDLETEVATQMAAEGLASDEDDLEAQMAVAMAEEIGESTSDEDNLEAQKAAAMGKDAERGGGLLDALSDREEEAVTHIKSVSFQQLDQSDENIDKSNIDRLMDVGLNLSVELGRKDMQIKEILNLGPGKIIELDKLAGEPVDLLVNGRLLAKGEVVVVDENFGVRITELIDPADRIKML